MVYRWDVVTIGNISRNRYWGERESQAYRTPLCTTTLVRGEGLTLLVDPSLADAERMAAELDRRTGLKPEAINVVFVTHEHGDHHAGMRHFKSARWLADPSVADSLNRGGQYSQAVEPVSGRLEEGIELLPTPGHTLDHHSVCFDCEGQRVVIAGDAVMTRDFWRERRGYFNSADAAQASATIERLAQMADIVVPGHDNYFVNPR